MRRRHHSWLHNIIAILLFCTLQGIAVFLMARNSVVQQAGIVQAVRSGHYLVWKRQMAIGNYFRLTTVNKDLAAENMRLRTELFKYQSAAIPSSPLDSIYTCISAEVIHNTTSHLQNFLIINKGSEHGIEPDMGVIGDHGVVGIVRNVSKYNSRVASLLHTKIPISVRIEPGQATGSLTWDGKSIRTASISGMLQHSQVAIGDTVFTSGFSQIFPARIPLGVITATNVTQGTYLEAQVRLFQNFNSLRYVSVVKSLHAQEINNLLKAP